MRKYDPSVDEARTGWDQAAIENAIERGLNLIVDQNNEVWSENLKEYIGKIRNCSTSEVIQN